MAKGDPHAARAAPLEMEGRPPPVHHPHRAVAANNGGRDRAQADRRDPDRPVSLPRQQDPHTLGQATHLTADSVESPLRREAHGGFGERSGETDREQSQHRAPGLLSARPWRAGPAAGRRTCGSATQQIR
jgi:hypothetical protein